jgi:CHAT domain-containing protein
MFPRFPNSSTRLVQGKMKWRFRWRYSFMALLSCCLWVGLTLGFQQGQTIASLPPVTQQAAAPPSYLQQAQQQYEAGQYMGALGLLQQAQQQAQQQQDQPAEILALSNLSLVHQMLGQWSAAETAVNQAMEMLTSQTATASTDPLQAQLLDVQGQLQFARGQVNQAMESWNQAADLYEQLGDIDRAALSRINQAQAFQAQGLYRYALTQLEKVNTSLIDRPDTAMKAIALRTLGDIYRIANDFAAAETALTDSLEMGQQLQRPDLVAAARLSLGNVMQSRYVAAFNRQDADAPEYREKALRLYAQVAQQPSAIAVQANLNALRFLTSSNVQDWRRAKRLYPVLQQQIADLPPGRSAVYAQVTFAQGLLALQQSGEAPEIQLRDIVQGLVAVERTAEALGDRRSRSLVLGNLGRIYELAGQFNDAKDLTQQALALSQAIQADDMSYGWQWQLGRLLKPDNQEGAIAVYSQAYDTLKSLRSDLITANPDLQFSFRDNVEPIYRDLVDLLLRQARQEPNSSQKQRTLEQARDVIDSLRLAELQNFFRSACLDATSKIDKVINQQDQTAAVIYPILLGDRLEIILKLSQTDLIQYPAIDLSEAEINRVLRTFRQELQEAYTYRDVKQTGQQIYRWLIQPMREELDHRGIKTLVFVLDGALRNIPMAALYDGSHYLVEDFAISLELGLAIRNPQPLRRDAMRILAAGLVDPPKLDPEDHYARLPNVSEELDFIGSLGLPTTILQDDEFTNEAFNESLNQAQPQVIHLATHGQFGADREDTFILNANGKVLLDELANLFKTDQRGRSRGIQLLVLSACRTATGDSRAVLGIAGTAVQAGARSAIASLWSLNDAASVPLIQVLYQQLGQPGVTRAEALRRAQLALLQDAEGDYTHPRYWSPYVLVGSWL